MKGYTCIGIPKRRFLAAILIFLFLAATPISYAASITVNDSCSLANAIRAANTDTATGGCSAGDGADTITLGADITLYQSLPAIYTEMTIESDDSAVKRTLNGRGRRRIFKVVYPGNLTINNLVLTNGRAIDSLRSRVYDADRGGAIFAVGSSSTLFSTVKINNSQIKNSRAIQGGAIYADKTDLTISNSSFTSNAANDEGGAIHNFTWGSISISNSVFSSNRAAGNNSDGIGDGNGGAISVEPAQTALTITNSIFSGNQAAGKGGAISYLGTSRTLTLNRSSLYNNSATGDGGAIYISAHANIENTTITGNRANTGGAIYSNLDGNINLKHVTIADNSATNTGGIYRRTDVADNRQSNFRLYNSIIANNTGGDCGGGLREEVASVILDGSCPASSIANPYLGTLAAASSGQKYYPLTDSQSPAINTADSTHCPSVDQLGNARPVGNGCDKGAIENTSGLAGPTPTLTYTPTSTPTPTDTPTATNTPLPAQLTVSATCSLGDAIRAANTDTATGGCPAGSGAADEIRLSGQVTLSGSVPSVNGEIHIIGNGHQINGSSEARFFEVLSGGHLRIDNTVLSGGRATKGGAIYVNSGGTLTMTNSTVKNSTAYDGDGGGIHIDGGNASITASTITGNSASKRGGGIYMAGDSRVTISRSTISNNTAFGDGGGGIYVNSGGTLTMANSTVKSNTASGGHGGGIYIDSGDASITTSIITNNFANQQGGGIFMAGGFHVTIKRNTISNNTARGHGGGIANLFRGVIRSYMLIENSTFYGNEGHWGGAIFVFHMGAAEIRFNTIANNRATGRTGGIVESGLEFGGNSFSLHHNIIASNNAGDCYTFTNQWLRAYNFIGDSSCPGRFSGDPGLGSLTGSPAYYPLLASSGAINRAYPSSCPSVDQAGNARPQGGGCDIGAFESAHLSPTATATATMTQTSTATATLTLTHEQQGAQAAATATATIDPSATCVGASNNSYYFLFPGSNFLSGSINLYSDATCQTVHSIITYEGDNGLVNADSAASAAAVCQSENDDGLAYTASQSTMNSSIWFCVPGEAIGSATPTATATATATATFTATATATNTLIPSVTNTLAPVGAREVSGLRASSNNPGELSVSWNAPSDSPADYRVMWAIHNQDYKTWTDQTGNAFPTSNSYTITGLDHSTLYKVNVRARYNGASGPWSGEMEALVMDHAVQEAQNNQDQPGVGDPPPTDTLVPTATDTLVPTATNTLVPTATNTLVPTATNTLVPTATNTLVPPTNTSVPVEPRVISNVRLSSNQAGVLEVTWDAPAQTPVDYRVNWARSDQDFPTWTDLSGNAFPTSNSYTITGLDAGARYKVQVRARYDDGNPGAWHTSVEANVAS